MRRSLPTAVVALVALAACTETTAPPDPASEVQAAQEKTLRSQDAEIHDLWADIQALTSQEGAQKDTRELSKRLTQLKVDVAAAAKLRAQAVAFDPCDAAEAEAGFAAASWLVLSEGALAAYAAGGYNPFNPVFLAASAAAGLAYGYYEFKMHQMYECYGTHGISW